MVAAKQDQATAFREIHKVLDAIPGVWSPVNHVSENDDRILGLGADFLDERPQARGTAVDVADSERTSGKPIIRILVLMPKFILELHRTSVHFKLLPHGGVRRVAGPKSV